MWDFSDLKPETTEMLLDWPTVRETRSVGSCIYCDSIEDLTDEHTFPLSIWGKRELIDGSCKNCQALIQPAEQYMSRDLLGAARQLLNAPSRKARKTGRWDGKRAMRDLATNELVKVPLPIALPMFLMPCNHYYARRLTGGMLLNGHAYTQWIWKPLFENGHEGVINRLAVEEKLIPDLVQRVIAKIAYCEYIFGQDLTYRNSEVTRFIRFGDENVGDFVGSTQDTQPSNRLHTVNFFCTESVTTASMFSIAAKVTLFHHWQLPSYWVWLGDVKTRPISLPLLKNPPIGDSRLTHPSSTH